MSIFDTEGGSGRTTDYTGTIVDWFAAENEYGTSLNIHTLLDHPEEFAWMPDGIAKEFFNTGPGWKPENGGQTVVHPDKQKFNANTDAGRLFSQLKVVPGAEEAFKGSPYEAASWKGLHFRWGAIEWKTNSFTGKDGTLVEAKIKVKAMPVELLGQAGSNGHVADFDLSTLGADDATLATLHTLANTTDTYSKFQAGLIALPGMPGSDVFKVLTDKADGPAAFASLKAF
jgi:hypothetical protein